MFDTLGAIWLLMFLSTFWLLWRRQWISATWLGGVTVLIFLTGSTGLVDVIVARDELAWASESARTYASTDNSKNRQPQETTQKADAVLFLGGAHYCSEQDVFGFGLGNGTCRLLTALELIRIGKAEALVIGGSSQRGGKSGDNASAKIQDWILASRLATGMVTNLGVCADTHDEALRFRELSDQRGWRRVFLVTSALHMRRSEAAFKKTGIEVVPVAADFQSYGVHREEGFSIFPRERRFRLLSLYVHEKVGWLVYHWKGWI